MSLMIECVLDLSTCGRNMFRCLNGQCLLFDKRRDGKSNCKDGSDEKECGISYLYFGYIKL